MSRVISAAMKHMVAAGMSPAAILAAVEDIEWALYETDPDICAAEQRRAKDRERKRVSKEGVSNSTDSTEMPIIILDNNPEGGVGETKNGNSTETPLTILQTVLDRERSEAVLTHRKRKKCPLTVKTAKMLAKQLALCRDPNAAADEMLLRGWTIVKPEWLKDSAVAKVIQFSASPPKRSWAEIKAEREREADSP